MKEGVVSCLFHRARTVAQGENIEAKEHLRGVLEGNRYPEALLRTASKPRTVTEPTEEPRATAFTPIYVATPIPHPALDRWDNITHLLGAQHKLSIHRQLKFDQPCRDPL